MADKQKEFMIEGAQIVFRNFSGEPGIYNKDGDRNFAIILDEDTASTLLADGWNVKRLKPRVDDDDDETQGNPYLQVSVRFDVRPPRIVLLTSSGRTNLNAETVGTIDWADIENVDLVCRGFEWDVNGKQGVKAYLKTMFVTINEDELERKYGVE